MEIKSLEKTSFETLFEGFSQAFVDYEIPTNPRKFQAMLKRRGYNPNLSFGMFEGEIIISFTLNGIGNFNGIKMAYNTGTGTLKRHRGKGLASKIFKYSIPYLKEANINYYLLEVLQNNLKAISLYRNIGFEITRELSYFEWKNEDLNNEIKNIETHCSIEKINIEKYPVSDFWDFYPSWQNSFESIQRINENFISLGAFVNRKLLGYCVFEPDSGDIAQIAVDKSFRRKGIGSLLLHEMSKLNKATKTRLINTDTSSSSIVNFLKEKNIKLSGKQYEMIKRI